MVGQGSSCELAAGAYQATSQNEPQAGQVYGGQHQKGEQGGQLCGESLLLTTLSKEKVEKAPFQTALPVVLWFTGDINLPAICCKGTSLELNTAIQGVDMLENAWNHFLSQELDEL